MALALSVNDWALPCMRLAAHFFVAEGWPLDAFVAINRTVHEQASLDGADVILPEVAEWLDHLVALRDGHLLLVNHLLHLTERHFQYRYAAKVGLKAKAFQLLIAFKALGG